MSATINNCQSLVEAFDSFNQHSADLQTSYHALQSEVAQLSVALATSQGARLKELCEKERIMDRLAQLLEALPALVLVLDGSESIVDANSRAISAFGGDLFTVSWPQLRERCLRASQNAAGEYQFTDERWFSLSRCPLQDGGEVLLLADITSTRSARERSAREQRLAMLGEMAARLAHQIRTPLSTAMLYASSGVRGDQAHPFADRIISRLRELEAMVADMLRFAAGTPVAEQSFSANDLIDEVAQGAKLTLPDTMQLIIEREADATLLSANRPALKGALENLLANARQHTPEDGVITLSCKTDANNVRLSVSDTGCGVSQSLRNNIFEPFFTTRAAGTGLGLAVVRSVAQANGGDVTLTTCESGSTFEISLPLESKIEGFPSGSDTSQFAISDDVSPATLNCKEAVYV